nr:MAG TPA: Protein of unknown function (DUF1435) [Caudoviricetes sp.]
MYYRHFLRHFQLICSCFFLLSSVISRLLQLLV